MIDLFTAALAGLGMFVLGGVLGYSTGWVDCRRAELKESVRRRITRQ